LSVADILAATIAATPELDWIAANVCRKASPLKQMVRNRPIPADHFAREYLSAIRRAAAT
jgi:hypothetical protein